MDIVKVWLSAFRLKTLPLAFSCIIMGSVLAFKTGSFNLPVFLLALFTTLSLQVLSNLANDYGDAVKGTDNENRIGPPRAVQSGLISKENMKKGVVVFAIISLVSGLALLYISFEVININFIGFVFLGLLSIAAAIKYTVGKNAFGYMSLGDLFVFLFFGWLGVIGVYYLYTHSFNIYALLPATCVGLFSAGVLNLNNLRDIDNDKMSNKITIAVRFGNVNARIYHLILLVVAWLCQIVFVSIKGESAWEWLFILSFPIFLLNAKKVMNHKEAKELNPSLKQLALATFLFTILYSVGLLISYA